MVITHNRWNGDVRDFFFGSVDCGVLIRVYATVCYTEKRYLALTSPLTLGGYSCFPLHELGSPHRPAEIFFSHPVAVTVTINPFPLL